MPVSASIDVKGSRLPRLGDDPSTRSGKSRIDSSPRSISRGASLGASLHKRTSSPSLGYSYTGESYDQLPKSPSPSSFLPSSTRPLPSTIRTQKSASSLRNTASASRPPVIPGRFLPPASVKRVPNTGTGSKSGTPIRKAPSTSNFKASTSTRSPEKEDVEESSAPPKSIKELLALKRAEAKKTRELKCKTGDSSFAQQDPTADLGENGEHWGKPAVTVEDAADELLGRPTIRETIEKARSTGHLNLSSRQLKVLPRVLFTIHLGVEPKRLDSESDQPQSPNKGGAEVGGVAWYEAEDLRILKAADNEIGEIQEEIGLFGGLRTVDFHKNPLHSLPTEFSDLGVLTHLDLSFCKFKTLPPLLAHLPSLTTLNMSNNILTSFTFALAPLASPRSPDPFFRPPSPTRQSNTPFPSLQILLLQGNKLTGSMINASFPKSVVKVDLSRNPIGNEGASLIGSLATLPSLKELRMQECRISDAGLPQDTVESAQSFISLEALDLSQNESLSEAAVRAKLFSERELIVVQDIDMTANHDTPKSSESFIPIRLAVGKVIRKELWEIEAEKRATPRKNGGKRVEPPVVEDDEDPFGFGMGFGMRSSPAKRVGTPVKELKKGSTPSSPTPAAHPTTMKEEWELDAATGLNTAAGRRRAEAKLVAQEPDAILETPSAPSKPVLTLDKYHASTHATLSLPPALPIPKGRLAHNRSQSIHSSSHAGGGGGGDLTVPLQTLPLALIVRHPWSAALRVLELSNRRADVCVVQSLLDPAYSNILPKLEELKLDGCNLRDSVWIRDEDSSASLLAATSSSPGKKGDALTEPTIRALMRLFPRLKVLDLSFNNLTTLDGVEEMFLPSLPTDDGSVGGSGGGLRVLRARSNQIDDNGLVPLIALSRKFREAKVECERWKGEEIDIRENSIAKLPPELGLLPLDILLVEGNRFRVPHRRIWEKEGTKGLLQWLRDTMI